MWRNALLKFSVFNNRPHTISDVPAGNLFHSRLSAPPRPHWDWRPQSYPTTLLPKSASSNASVSSRSPPFVNIPSPPVNYSIISPLKSPMNSAQAPTVNFPPTTAHSRLHHDTFPPRQHPLSSFCCSVSQGRLEVEQLLSSFKEDLNTILTNTFGPLPPRFVPPFPPAGRVPPAPPVAPYPYPIARHFPLQCATCRKPLHFWWFTCQTCIYHAMVCTSDIALYTNLNVLPVLVCGLLLTRPRDYPSEFHGYPPHL